MSKKKCGFSVFFLIFHCYNHRFLPNFTRNCSKTQIVDNEFILLPKGITVVVWCQILIFVENIFLLWDKKTYFYMESIIPIRKYSSMNRQLFQPYYKWLHRCPIFCWEKWFCSFVKYFSVFVPSIICKMKSFSILSNISG